MLYPYVLPKIMYFLLMKNKNMQTARNLYWEWGLCLSIMEFIRIGRNLSIE